MARYVKDFWCDAPAQAVFDAVNNYLVSEKYEYISFDNENVFKKGEGFLSSPSFFKLTFFSGIIRLETWMKYVLFPGVFFGEFSTTGFSGAAVRGPWLRRIETVESIIASFGGVAYSQPVDIPVNSYADNINGNVSFANCANCGNPIVPGAANCSVCGAFSAFQGAGPAQMQYGGQPISRKEFVENYLPPSEKRNINSIAYLCYFCAAITAVFSLMLNPWGLIDAFALAGFALGMQLTKNKIFAILILILSIIEVIVGLFMGSYPVWWLVAGVASVVIFRKIEKKYKQFINKQ